MDSPGVVEVDLAALASNYQLIADTVEPSACAAVVKADAYGLGMSVVAPRLFEEGCRDFFVATLEEGIELRDHLPTPRIYVFEGVFGNDVEDFAGASLTPVLNTVAQVHRWKGAGAPAVIHLDTGMTRLGLDDSDITQVVEEGALDGVEIAYVMTHLACGDEPEHPLNRAQVRAFDTMRRRLPGARTSIANSAGAFLSVEHRGDLVRPGIALYGGNPFASRASPVETVATVKARVIQLRTLSARATVGYGATFAAEPGARIAVLGIGYADGYPRVLSNRGIASVAGIEVPVVGRVSMDLVCIDVTLVPRDKISEGDFVELIGRNVPLDDVAQAAGTISYELLTSLGPRLQRVYVEDGLIGE